MTMTSHSPFPVLSLPGPLLPLHGQAETVEGQGPGTGKVGRLSQWKLLCCVYVQPSSSAPQRPRLSLTVNAKVPTAFRQKFLDSIIDEHLKMNPVPEEVYSQVSLCPCCGWLV